MTADDHDPAPPSDGRPTVAASAVAELEALVRRIRKMQKWFEGRAAAATDGRQRKCAQANADWLRRLLED